MANLLKIPFCPTQANYAVTFGDPIERIQLDGGPSRRRVSVWDMPHTVTVQWVLRGANYSLFMGFVRRMMHGGSSSFLIDLPLDTDDFKEYEASFVGMPQLVSKSAEIYTISASLEVEATPDLDGGADDYWATVALLNDAYGDSASTVLDLLAKLVNQDLPHE